MSDHPSRLTGIFRRPFREQVAFWRRKLGNLIPTQRWDDIEHEAHDRAFMVAGAQKADLLTDLAAAVDRAITEGTSLDTFQRDFRAIVQRHGWHGWTGEGTKGGEAWRVRTIYRTNAKTSYAAGRMAQLRAAGFPLWVYHHGGSQEPREQHLHEFNGLVLPPDHEFWTIFYPPSGWGCSCYVTGARSERAARRQGGDPDRQLRPDWNQPDPETGLPAGVDRGWAYAPGASVSDEVSAIAGKLGSWDYRIGKAFMEEVPESMADALARSYRSLPSVADDARRYARRNWEVADRRADYRTLGMLTRDQYETVAARAKIEAPRLDFSLVPTEIVHVQKEHGDERDRLQRSVTPDDFARLPAVLQDGAPRFVGESLVNKLPVFEISRTINGEEFVTRWEYRGKRRTLVLLSFFIRIAGG